MTGLGTDALNGPRGLCIDGPSGLLFIADREVLHLRVYSFIFFIIQPLLLSTLLVMYVDYLHNTFYLTDLHLYISLSHYFRIIESRSTINPLSYSYVFLVTAKGHLLANFTVLWKFV